MTTPPAVVLIYGHTRGGTPIMLAIPQTALDLPFQVLVRQEADGLTPARGGTPQPCCETGESQRSASPPGEHSSDGMTSSSPPNNLP